MALLDWSLSAGLGVAVLVSGLVALGLTPLVIRGTRLYDLVAYPQANRWHQVPTPSMGGIAMYGGATLAVGILLPLSELWAVWGGATLMFVVGGLDDRRTVRPAVKILTQLMATGLLVRAGYVFGPEWPLWLSLPVTAVWVLGITNATNLLDNMDGLAAGVVALSASVLTGAGFVVGAHSVVLMGGSVLGAALGFLYFNFKPARIFMGDCGSLFLGYLLAALPLLLQPHLTAFGGAVEVLVPVLALAVPVLDTTLVSIMRIRAGRSVANGGRDHTSHRLVFRGLSESQAVLFLYGLAGAAGAWVFVVFVAGEALFCGGAVLIGGMLGAVGISLGQAEVYQVDEVGGDGAPATAQEWRVLVYGTGQGGQRALQALRRDTEASRPVGVVTDDPSEQGRDIRGVQVLGTGDELPRLCRAHDVDAVVVAETLSDPAKARLSRRCEQAGVSWTQITAASPVGDQNNSGAVEAVESA